MKKPCQVKFTSLADNDLDNLSDDLFEECMSKIEELEHNINLGKPLQNKNDKDLSDCRKIYFDHARYRIVYRIIDNCSYEILGVSKVPKAIAEVIAIGKRNNQEVYIDAAKRLGRL